jgi:hypothetical protein
MKNTRRLMERRGVIPYLWRGLYVIYSTYQKFGNAREERREAYVKADFRRVPKKSSF